MSKEDQIIELMGKKQAVCYLHAEAEDLKLWNFLTPTPALLNTKLLFWAATRPHFDYCFKHIDFLGLDGLEYLDLAEEPEYKGQLANFKDSFVSHQILLENLQKSFVAHKFKTTLITTKALVALTNLSADATIVLDDINLFGNPEPVWRKIQLKLPKRTDVFLLALGPEKFLIGPRLKIKFNLPVLDVKSEQPQSVSAYNKFKAATKRLIYK